MGIDVDIRVFAEPTADLVGHLRALAATRDDVLAIYVVDANAPLWLRNIAHDCRNTPHVRIGSVDRFYGTDYRRGQWPRIRDLLFAIREIARR